LNYTRLYTCPAVMIQRARRTSVTNLGHPGLAK